MLTLDEMSKLFKKREFEFKTNADHFLIFTEAYRDNIQPLGDHLREQLRISRDKGSTPTEKSEARKRILEMTECAALGFALGGFTKTAKKLGLQLTFSKYFVLNKILQDEFSLNSVNFIDFKQALRQFKVDINRDFARVFLRYHHVDLSKESWIADYNRLCHHFFKISIEDNEPIELEDYKISEFYRLHKLMSQALLLELMPNYYASGGRDSALDCINSLNKYYQTSLKNYPQLNAHQNPYLDKLLGIAHTASWREAMKIMRDSAYKQLMEHVEKQSTQVDKLALLEKAKTLSLFNEHRNNTFFKGAFGRTATVKKIDDHIKQINDLRHARQHVRFVC